MGRKKKNPEQAEMIFSQRLDDLLLDAKENGVSLSQIAETTGISKASLSTWRAGNKLKGIPKVDYIRKLAEYFGVTVDWLAGTPGAPRRPDENLAATNLTAAAVKNLIDLNEICQMAAPVLSDHVLSDIIASVSFTKLIESFIHLAILTADLDANLQILRAGEPVENFPFETFQTMTEALQFGRYAFIQPCSEILDTLCDRPIDATVAEARKFVDF